VNGGRGGGTVTEGLVVVVFCARGEGCSRIRGAARGPTRRKPAGPSLSLSLSSPPSPTPTQHNLPHSHPPTHSAVDPAYVGRATPIGSAVEGGAYDAAGGLTPAGAAAIQSLALARTVAGSGSLFSGMGADGVAALGGGGGGATSYVAGTKELAAAADPAAVAAHDAAVLATAERARAAAAAAAAMQAEAATRPLTAATAAASVPPTVIEQQRLAEHAEEATAASPSAAPAAVEEGQQATLPPLRSLVETATARLADTTRPLPSAAEASGFVADAANRLASAAGTGAPAGGAAPRDDAELLSAVVAAAAAGVAARLTGGGGVAP
jgi:hypothetical protein